MQISKSDLQTRREYIFKIALNRFTRPGIAINLKIAERSTELQIFPDRILPVTEWRQDHASGHLGQIQISPHAVVQFIPVKKTNYP